MPFNRYPQSLHQSVKGTFVAPEKFGGLGYVAAGLLQGVLDGSALRLIDNLVKRWRGMPIGGADVLWQVRGMNRAAMRLPHRIRLLVWARASIRAIATAFAPLFNSVSENWYSARARLHVTNETFRSDGGRRMKVMLSRLTSGILALQT